MFFDALPPALFKPLTAPGAKVYASILSDLYAESRRAPHPLSRAVVLDIVIHHTVSASADPLASADETLNYLESCGWVRSEIRRDVVASLMPERLYAAGDGPPGRLYTTVYALTPHAFRLLGLVNPDGDAPPSSPLLAIHDLLQIALRDPDAGPRLGEAARLTAQLQAGLKEQQHNPAKDDVTLTPALYQNIIDAAARLETKYPQARFIRETFQSFDRLLADMVAHRPLTPAHPADNALRHKLSSLITSLLSADPDSFTKTAAPLINLFTAGDADTVSPAAESAPPFVPDPASPPAPTAAQIEAARRETARQINRPINRERVSRLAQALLRDKTEVRAAEVAQIGAADLSLLLQLRLYGDGSLGYAVEDGAWVEVNGLGFRDFVLHVA
jgi:hypothetical protein